METKKGFQAPRVADNLETRIDMDNGKSIEAAGGHSEKDYDDAVRMSQDMETQITNMMNVVTPLGLELQLATMLIACVYPVVWAVVAFFYVAICIYGVHRGAAKKRIKEHDIEGAKTAFASAKTWSNIVAITEVIMAGIEIWGIIQLVNYFKGE
jgi:hypothetical protein